MDKTQTMNVAYDRVSLLILFLHVKVSIPMTMRSSNSLTPKEYLVCDWVTIKMLYRYLRRCLLSGHGSRLGFVTPCDGKVSQGQLGNTTSQ